MTAGAPSPMRPRGGCLEWRLGTPSGTEALGGGEVTVEVMGTFRGLGTEGKGPVLNSRGSLKGLLKPAVPLARSLAVLGQVVPSIW